MSTVPPPPPPFGYGEPTTPPPSAYPTAYDQRMTRAQRRTLAAQARAQRAHLRLQLRATQRNSAVGPLLLVVLGVTLLLLETGRLRWTDAFLWLGRWWPAVLILAGLVMLAEWFWDRSRAASAVGGVVPRRTLGGGAALLLTLLAIGGVGSMVAENSSTWARRNLDPSFLDNNFEDLRQLIGSRIESTQELQAALSKSGDLTIENPRGDVTVTGSSQDGRVHVTVHQHLFGWQSSDVQKRRDSEQASLTGDPAHLVLTVPAHDDDDADLTIEVPHDAPVTLRSTHGDLSLEELRGAVTVEAHGGDVKLTALSGPVHVSTQDDDATVTAHSLGSGLALSGRSGDIALSDVEGTVELRGDFFGTTHLEHIHGPVHFKSSFTELSCAGIPGELNVEGRTDLDAHRVEGPFTVSTTNRNLTLNEMRGGVAISDRNGSVDLTLSGASAPVQVTNADGSVEVAIPSGQGFALQAQTHNGKIENEFGLSPQSSGETESLQGTLGKGGPALHLETSEGDITVRHTSADEGTWASEPNELHLAPANPGRTSKPTKAKS